MSDSEIEDDIQNTPPELKEAASAAALNVLPAKSKIKYEAAYNIFNQWKTEKKAKISENCLLVYFKNYMEKYKPSTVWSHYSMLKSMIKVYENIDISTFYILVASIKKNSKGFESKKSSVFTGDQIKQFLENAPDDIHLARKVIIFFGIMGCCRSDEITHVTVQDVKQEGGILVVSIPKTKTSVHRKFTIDSNLSVIVKKYMALRPDDCQTNRFFLNYQAEKCTRQPIGKNKIALVPKDIAILLKLDDHESYTGHALRRTSATLLSNAGGTMMDLKHLGGWQSDRVAQGYVEDSLLNKTRISTLVAKSISNDSPTEELVKEKSCKPDLESHSPPLKRFKTDHPQNSFVTPESGVTKNIYINNCNVTINN